MKLKTKIGVILMSTLSWEHPTVWGICRHIEICGRLTVAGFFSVILLNFKWSIKYWVFSTYLLQECFFVPF